MYLLPEDEAFLLVKQAGIMDYLSRGAYHGRNAYNTTGLLWKLLQARPTSEVTPIPGRVAPSVGLQNYLPQSL